MTYKPKLIEVALPLAAINTESAREKSIRHGHPSTLHLWWARRPLAAARAVIWASLVDDPSGDSTLTNEQQDAERKRLFGILERLVVWENSNNPDVLAEAKAEIDRCYPDGPPPIVDPFGGGGAIPLEAQRLGLQAITGDLNPVAVLIQKAMLEIPPRFANRPAVHPDTHGMLDACSGTHGLAADVEAYGKWMRGEAHGRIGHLYPDATGPNGEKLTPIAWIWARTVESPDPSWNGHVPLVASWTLSKKKGKPTIWIEPIIDRESQTITYEIREGGTSTHDRTVNRGNGTCIATGAAIPGDYVKEQSRSGRMSQQLMAVVAQGSGTRSYMKPYPSDTEAANTEFESWRPTSSVAPDPRNIWVTIYGLDEWWKLFTPRQLVALTTFSDLLPEVWDMARRDATAGGFTDDGVRLRDGGAGATAYADAIVTYLAFAVDKMADRNCSICSWDSSRMHARNVFARQAIPMTWDFAENNPLGESSGSWSNTVSSIVAALRHLPGLGIGNSEQRDARIRVAETPGAVVSTDPPYYDNISYADLSDFFYVWLRRNLSDVWPDECATLATPKSDELIANQYRAGSRQKAEQHFESGMAEFMAALADAQHGSAPATIYYAYKATETKDGEVRSTGWDTFLQAVVDAGLSVTATWPIRTELANRPIARGTSALASSIVLACRPREVTAQMATRAEFVAALRRELPEAVRLLQSGNIAPVDIPQSTMGPGIGVFSRYARVVESDGSTMRVSTALGLINDVLSEVLDGEESEMDADSRFALSWYSQFRFDPGSSGDADGMARAKNTSTVGVVAAGIGEVRAGTFRLFERSELDPAWTPAGDDRLTVWEATQHLIGALERSEREAAALLHQLGGFGERARTLTYLLFKKATDKGWAAEAGAYNSLITAWPALRTAQLVDNSMAQQSIDFGSQEN
jgi:putative DNA methylase